MPAYYNEHDKFAAAWLRNLIAAGHIAPGDVDERDIRDVRPDDLRSYTQCHFFAGIGVWSYGLRRAGWADDRPVWTGSCPCQPFSQAGQGGGFADERHLWPAFYHLIAQSRPDVVFGEQVASKDGLAWLDLVQADLEGTQYRFGALDLCAAGFGAPHIRQRLYWVGHTSGERRQQVGRSALGDEGPDGRQPDRNNLAAGAGADGIVGVPTSGRRPRFGYQSEHGEPLQADASPGELADANGRDAGAEGLQRSGQHGLVAQDGGAHALANAEHAERWPQHEIVSEAHRRDGPGRCSALEHPGPTNGVWRDADWLHCRDGKWRPVRPGSFPLAHGAPARVGRLRAYGNAVVAPQVEEFVKAYLEANVLLGVME